LVRETGGFGRLADAAQLRTQAVSLLVDTNTSVTLARAAMALALRCFSGPLQVMGLNQISSELRAAVTQEAAAYGAPRRLSFEKRQLGPLTLGLSCRSGDSPFVAAAGWIAGINREIAGPTPESPAAAFAAAAGIAKLFLVMLGAPTTAVQESWQLSLWTLTSEGAAPEGDNIDIGRVLAIGAGAVGSGLAHVLRHSGWQGHVEFVDKQVYEEPNHETTMLISQQNARDC
jgi:hypothetical protein